MPHRNSRRAQLVFALMGALVLLSPAAASALTDRSVTSARAEAVVMVPADLEEEKLREEVRKLQIENDRNEGGVGVLLALAPFVTAMVAVVTLAVAVFKQQHDRKREKAADDERRHAEVRERQRQADADREQRRREEDRRFDERFEAAIAHLGDSSEALQSVGASSLLRIQNGASPELQREILLFAIAQLRSGSTSRSIPLLKEVFQRSLRAAVEQGVVAPQGVVPDVALQHADLAGLDLSHLDLSKVAVNLSEAELTGASLASSHFFRMKGPHVVLDDAECYKTNFGPAILTNARGRGANFKAALLGSAKLQEAELDGASFRGASLTSAHFERAFLRGVDFSYAVVVDAYFTRAIFDDATLRTLALAKGLDRAHLDPAAATAIEAIRASGTDDLAASDLT